MNNKILTLTEENSMVRTSVLDRDIEKVLISQEEIEKITDRIADEMTGITRIQNGFCFCAYSREASFSWAIL